MKKQELINWIVDNEFIVAPKNIERFKQKLDEVIEEEKTFSLKKFNKRESVVEFGVLDEYNF